MKKYLISIITICALASCSKWLDVTPQSEVSKDALFETEDGFKEALNGLYTRLTQDNLFGRETSVGTVEVLVQNYATGSKDDYKYYPTMQYNYREQNFVNRSNEIWKGYYNVIANSNLILENVDEHRNVFIGGNYNIVKGEALAMRAFCHFDVLRLYADAFATDPNGKGIPYVTSFSNKTPQMVKVGEALDLMIKDLNEAKTLLQTSDPILQAGYKIGYNSSDTATEGKGNELFIQQRRHRLNYYAVCGELARVYLYKNDLPNALSNALIVINSNKFPWTKQTDFMNADDEKKDRILYNELLFGLFGNSANDRIRWALDNGQSALYVSPAECRTIYETGGVGGDDYRFKQWFQEQGGASGNYLRIAKYMRDGDRNLHDLMIPAIRLSEMYYIAAECTFDTDAAKAWDYFNTVRFNRGIGTKLNDPSKTVFMNELVKEARKEFFAEGQLFFMYKRLNRGIAGPSGSTIAPSKAVFVWPFPDDEIAYGNR